MSLLQQIEQNTMMQRSETDEELTPELITTINGLHKKYIEYISAQEA